jgi:hypothetical protein
MDRHGLRPRDDGKQVFLKFPRPQALHLAGKRPATIEQQQNHQPPRLYIAFFLAALAFHPMKTNATSY